jgi:hypothetical protein
MERYRQLDDASPRRGARPSPRQRQSSPAKLIGELGKLLLSGTQIGRELHRIEQRRFRTITHRFRALRGAVRNVTNGVGNCSR